MSKAALAELEWWNMAEVHIPERSILYSPAPIGMGTALGESLTSYLARLAEAHCVYPGVLLQEMIVPLMVETETRGDVPEQHSLWRRDGNGSHLVNVTGPRSQAALRALETLTLRTDLHSLALTALTELLPIRGLMRNRLAWCPKCYDEWQSNGQVLYDPLLWKFREISMCTRHGMRLQTSCSHCARSLPHLTWRSQPGYCAFCAGQLFGEHRMQGLMDSDSSEFIWQQWVTETLRAVIAQLPTVQAHPKRERIQQVVNRAVERFAGGNIAEFARLLELPRNTVENWCQGKRIPEMDMLLRLCYRLSLSLYEVLFGDTEVIQPHLQDPLPEAHFSSRKRTAIDKERIFYLLEQETRSGEDPPPSLQEVGQRLGYEPTSLYKINRAACHAIAECYRAYRRALREKRLQGYREEIRQIALLLQAEKVALTRLHIARYLMQPAILRDPKVRKILQEVCREMSNENAESMKNGIDVL